MENSLTFAHNDDLEMLMPVQKQDVLFRRYLPAGVEEQTERIRFLFQPGIFLKFLRIGHAWFNSRKIQLV